LADETPSGEAAQPAPAAPLGSEASTIQPPPYVAPASATESAPEAEPQSWEFESEEPKPSNFMVGLAAGVGLGLLAAIAYAVITIVSDREFAALAVLLGVAVAFGFTRFGRTQGIVAGIVAAIVALGFFFVAVFVASAGLIAKEYGDPFLDSLSLVIQNADLVVEAYFEDPLSYVFVGIAALIAFLYASGLRGKKVGKQS